MTIGYDEYELAMIPSALAYVEHFIQALPGIALHSGDSGVQIRHLPPPCFLLPPGLSRPEDSAG
jgi:hypothetical protein